MTVDHPHPYDGVRYIHTGTDDLVEFIGRDDGAYKFSVNGGERTTAVPTEDWSAYREFLEDGGRV